MIVHSTCEVSTIFKWGILVIISCLFHFQYLSSGKVSYTTTQNDSIANGAKTEQENGAGPHLTFVALAVFNSNTPDRDTGSGQFG